MSIIVADTFKARVVGAAITTEKGLNVGGACTSTSFVGPLTGDVTGNADTATTLATARDIGGVSFNGSASINLPGVNQSGTQNTSGTAGGLSGSPNIDVSGLTVGSGITMGSAGVHNSVQYSRTTVENCIYLYCECDFLLLDNSCNIELQFTITYIFNFVNLIKRSKYALKNLSIS